MNLRLTEGLDLEAYRARWGMAPEAARIADLSAQGLLQVEGGRLSATPRGMLVLNAVIAALTN
jgi:coproporphyrinogen III oxidase-like Fe-S oxidoreductase